jgi:hypothetical protein
VIKLGPGNDAAALEALKAWPGTSSLPPPPKALTNAVRGCIDSLHIGGGITDANAMEWLDAGAEKVRSPHSLPSTYLSDARNDPRSSSRRSCSRVPSLTSGDCNDCQPKLGKRDLWSMLGSFHLLSSYQLQLTLD